MAFCACFTLIHDNLVDEREKPTITTNEEILLDDLPAPAFSILVPEVDASAYLRMRMPNSARACDAKVNVSRSEFLKQYLVVTKAIHKAVRKAYVPSDDEVVDFARQMRNQLNYPLYPRFCAAMSELNSTGRSILVKELTSRIDSFLMVSDLEGMVSGLLPAIMNGSHPDECDQNKTTLDFNVVREWMILNAPLAFKENHGLQCGFCTPGMIMSATDMVARLGKDLDEATIRSELEGNICRCTGYEKIVEALKDVSASGGLRE